MSLIPGSDLLCAFPALADLDGPASDALRQARRTLALDAGTPVFEAGQECRQYLLIQAGSVRVHFHDSDGHKIVLYRLGRGETCILTTAALLGRTRPIQPTPSRKPRRRRPGSRREPSRVWWRGQRGSGASCSRPMPGASPTSCRWCPTSRSRASKCGWQGACSGGRTRSGAWQ